MPGFKRRPLAAAVLMMFAVPQLVQAQQGAEATLPEVKVRGAQEGFRTESTGAATRTETPLRDVPQVVNTVPQALIRSQGATSLQDALRNVPGVSYAAAEGGTQANQLFYLRGFPSGGDLFLDGIRDIGEYNRDLFNVESVEVMKGSSALMFGRGSTGGVINQSTKVADLFSRKEVGFTLGSFDQKRLTGDVNVKMTDTSALRLVALAEKSGAYRYPQDVKRLGFAPSLRFGIGTGTELALSYSYLDTEEVTDYGQPTLSTNATGFMGFAPLSPRKYYGLANHDFANHQTHIATAKLEHRISRTLTLKNTLRWANYKRQTESTIATLRATDSTGAAVTAATPLDRLMVTRRHDQGRTRDNDDDVLINQTELHWKLATGGVKHTVLAGFELGRERLNRWNYALDGNPATGAIDAPTSDTPLLNPDPSTNLNYSKTPNQRAVSEAKTVALYAQDQMELSQHWKALLGLRWERYAASAQTSPLRVGAPAATSFARTDNMLSGRAGLMWQPSDAQSYYLSYGNSYNPSGELGVYGGTATNLNAVNQNLDPEKSRNYELGAQWDLFRTLRLRSAIFRNEKTNARMADPATGVTVLAGVRQVNGIEFELAGAITPNWDVYGGVAFMNGEIKRGPANVQGRRPLGVAQRSGNLWTVYRLGGGWEIGGGVRANSGAYLNDANTAKLPSYAVWDATVAWVQRKYEIRANLYNLADKRYYTGGYNNNPNRVLPGQPRAVALTLRYNFD
ncbi:MAG: TonB-dependent receptor [Burkholderiales bacterium]